MPRIQTRGLIEAICYSRRNTLAARFDPRLAPSFASPPIIDHDALVEKHRPSVQRILADVASLSHDQRYRRMVELGRASLTDAHLAEDLRSLAQSEIHYERLLALMSASGSCAEDLIVTMLADPSPMLTSRAARLAARALPDEILIRLMPDLTKPCRVDLACRLWQSGRGQVNDAVYPTLEGTARRHLLSWTTDAFIERHLDAEQMAALDAPQWATLAQRLPGFVRDRLTHALEQSGNPSYVLRLAVRASLYRMLRSDPDAGLSLLRVAFTRMPVHDLPLARYGSLFPKEIAAIIAGLGGRQRIALTVQTLKRLDASTLCELLAADALPNLHEVFPHLNAGQRDALYRQGGEAWREHSGRCRSPSCRPCPARPGRPKRATRSRCGCWPPSRWPGCLICPACRSRRRWPWPSPFCRNPMANCARRPWPRWSGRGGTRLPACPPSWISAARVKTSGTPCGWPC